MVVPKKALARALGVITSVVLLAAVVVIAFGLASRGPTLRSFLLKADPICADANDALATVEPPTRRAGFVAYGVEVAAATKDEVARLRLLKAPTGRDGRRVRTMIASLARGAADADNVNDQGVSGSIVDFAAPASAASTEFHRADVEARSLGSATCGSSQASLASAAAASLPTATKFAFIEKADAICKATTNHILDLPLPGSPGYTPLSVLDRLIELEQHEVDDLHALPAPSLDRPAFDAWFAALTAELDLNRQLRSAFASNDQAKGRDVLRQLASSQLAEKADIYGFHDCGTAGLAGA